ncbi:MAG: cyclophilin family peptidyl-prolyl cis-trans isomerase [Chlamydiales bacterium]|jgi:cyclophilin family peptidyl-prolyl cis-trans isomerase
MAKHKTATEVTIVHEERSSFGKLVDRLWKPAAAVAVLGTGLIVGAQYNRTKEHDANAAQWDTIRAAIGVNAFSGQMEGTAADLEAALGSVDGTAHAWGEVALVAALVENRDYDQALAALSRVRTQDLPAFNEQQFPFSEGEMTLAEHLEKSIKGQQEWELSRTSLFENPPAPAGSPRARIETSAGTIVVELYQEAAPKHVENFLKLCDEEFYTGTKFHRVIANFMVQGGDPNTKEGEVDTWGQGGPDYKIDAEENDLKHFRGYMSAAKQPGEEQSSGSQFFFTTGDALHLDGLHVVYGRVVEGMDVVDEIGTAEIDTLSTTRDRPVDPVVLNKAVRLE